MEETHTHLLSREERARDNLVVSRDVSQRGSQSLHRLPVFEQVLSCMLEGGQDGGGYLLQGSVGGTQSNTGGREGQAYWMASLAAALMMSVGWGAPMRLNLMPALRSTLCSRCSWLSL